MKIKLPKFPELIKEADWEGYEDKEVEHFLEEWDPLKLIKFHSWFSGQTGGISSQGKFCVYKHDFIRFLEQEGLLLADLEK